MRKIGCAAAHVAGAAIVAGCAVTTGDGARLRPGEPAFADYVESVFRLQNDAATQLAFELEAADLDSPRYAELEAAETTLLTACDGLNALASARQRGDDARGLSALRAARRAPDCERAVQAALGTLGVNGS